MWKKMMHRMVYSCDVATFYITKSEYQKLTFMENLRLRMHLMGCEFCRRFQDQNTMITRFIDVQKIDRSSLKMRKEKKIEIKKELDKQINSTD